MDIAVVGFPYAADLEAECFDLLRSWTEAGARVRVLVTAQPTHDLVSKLTGIGCEPLYHLVSQNHARILEATSIRHDIVVGLYSPRFFDVAGHLRTMGCKLVLVGEGVVSEAEKAYYEQWGVCDAYVVKSCQQQAALIAELADFGCVDKIRRLRPAFYDTHSFNILPHVPGDIFTIGKAGCVIDQRYYPTNYWQVISSAETPVRAIVSEWAAELKLAQDKPTWADSIERYSASKLMQQVHCLAQISNRKESWPRFALDAMASGVPVIAQNDGGWKELIRHGENGFICNSPAEVVDCIDLLAYDENFRIRVAVAAREYLLDVAGNKAVIDAWRQLFEELS